MNLSEKEQDTLSTLIQEVKNDRVDQKSFENLRISVQELRGTVEMIYRDINGNGRKGIFELFEEYQYIEEKRLESIEGVLQELKKGQEVRSKALQELRAERAHERGETYEEYATKSDKRAEGAKKRQRVQLIIAVSVFLLLQIPLIITSWQTLLGG